MVSKVDWMGRVTIPKSIRKQLGVLEEDEFNISLEGDKIILTLKTEEN